MHCEKIKKSIRAFIFFSHSLSRSLCHLAAACTIDQFEIAAPQLCTAYVLKSKHPICERSCWCDLSDLWTFPTKDFDWTPRVISEPSELVGSLNAADDVTRLQSHLLFDMWASRACCCYRRTGIKILNYIHFVVCSQLAEANNTVDFVTLTLPHWISDLIFYLKDVNMTNGTDIMTWGWVSDKTIFGISSWKNLNDFLRQTEFRSISY